MYSYRVFISYSHEDRNQAVKIVDHLTRIGLRAMCDLSLAPGASFTDQIKKGIAFSHAFVPLLTASSAKRTWVHQEIGYAMGVEVPVLPVAIGEVPEGIIQQVQAITVNPDLSDLDTRLTARNIEYVVTRAQAASVATIECAPLPQDRTAMIVRYANTVADFNCLGKVRQRGAFTSFCIPDKPLNHEVWRQREGAMPRDDYYHQLQRAERRALERHASDSGCDLIIDPSIPLTGPGVAAKRVRLRTLREFLESMPDDKIRVVVQKSTARWNLLLVGDWFVAESISARKGKGYYQTVFTRHAPTVLERLEQFDSEFEELLGQFAPHGASSRKKAIEALDREIENPSESRAEDVT